jgi:hypothetical protein
MGRPGTAAIEGAAEAAAGSARKIPAAAAVDAELRSGAGRSLSGEVLAAVAPAAIIPAAVAGAVAVGEKLAGGHGMQSKAEEQARARYKRRPAYLEQGDRRGP